MKSAVMIASQSHSIGNTPPMEKNSQKQPMTLVMGILTSPTSFHPHILTMNPEHTRSLPPSLRSSAVMGLQSQSKQLP